MAVHESGWVSDREGRGLMREELCRLRKRMQEESVDAYLIMTDDFHGSEYVGDYFKSREYISGFTGSAGTPAGEEGLRRSVDGWKIFSAGGDAACRKRHHPVSLRPAGCPGSGRLPAEQLADGQTLGFDGRCVMAGYARKLRERLEQKGVRIRNDLDLVGDVWRTGRALSKEPVWQLAGAVCRNWCERQTGRGQTDSS